MIGIELQLMPLISNKTVINVKNLNIFYDLIITQFIGNHYLRHNSTKHLNN